MLGLDGEDGGMGGIIRAHREPGPCAIFFFQRASNRLGRFHLGIVSLPS